MSIKETAEYRRLSAHTKLQANWKKWGPYLSERAWGTVREDYSQAGDPWSYFPHDHARSRTYRWNEDGLAGISDRNQYFCLSLSLWNEKDPFLKERLFGVTGTQGNHGEDVKEYYYYIDNTPTHSYMKMLYKYPQAEFPYEKLVEENQKRTLFQFEYELIDTKIFEENRYFDVFIEYAKGSQDDVLMRIEVINRGPDEAVCHVIPTFWFRNTWNRGYPAGPMNDTPERPKMQLITEKSPLPYVEAVHHTGGTCYLYAQDAEEWLFTENETNRKRLYGQPNITPFVKDGIHRYIVDGEKDAVNPEHTGTKVGIHHRAKIAPGKSEFFHLRLSNHRLYAPFENMESVFADRIAEADAFYLALQPRNLKEELRSIQRQAFAGLLWTKQLYYYDVELWLKGDKDSILRQHPRNKEWEHLVNFDIISMPDKWEYPWYASWDLGFHCIPLAMLDAEYAKRQLVLMTREWYMHPNGQLPAYEWNFSDVNPPVLAWAAWRVYKIDCAQEDKPDTEFLTGIFHKLMLNFTWWVNRKDADGHNVFQGGFLGLDNISLFDRSSPPPTGGHIDQADGTAWMGFYCILMMKIALELSKERPIYQDSATKFFEHYLRIASAMVKGSNGHSLWNEEDGFFYDQLHLPDDSIIPLKVRSLVGLLPLFAVETIDPELMNERPVFARRIEWFVSKRPDYTETMACIDTEGVDGRRLLSILDRERLVRVLRYMLDESEFLSEFGIRSLSKHHEKHPYNFTLGDQNFCISYQPAEAQSGLFGGNSNWRGPVWFPINYLIIESLQKYYHYYGDSLKVECPTGSGVMMTLQEVADEISKRLIRLFMRDTEGNKPVFGGNETFQKDPHWKDLTLFYEYFQGDNGAGLGASHQTGWTALVAKLIRQTGESM